MRSMFWLGGALLVCAASFVYLAADFASRHPDSLAVRCARAAHTMTVQCNPVAALASAATSALRTANELMWQAMTVANEAPKSAGCTPHAPCAKARECKPCQPMEVIDLSLVADPAAPEDGEEEAEAPPGWPNFSETSETVTVPPSVIEESEDVEASMPPAQGDEEEIPPPTEMPEAPMADEQVPTSPAMEDLIREQLDATRQQVFEMWFDLFQKETSNAGNTEVTGDEPPSDSPAAECQEEPKMEDGTVAEPAMAPETGAQEESEPAAPDCQEDPNYHKNHPGCPYMGSDPATHRCSEPLDDPLGTPKHHRRKKVKASPIVDPKPDAEEAEEPPTDAMIPFPMNAPRANGRPRNLGPTSDNNQARHPEVDTMEFRKSDAKEGEFDSRPF